MLDPEERPCRRPLGDNLILRTVVNERDIDRVAAFNGAVHGPEVGAMTRGLLLHHPATRARDLFFVEDEENGLVVSSLCLIPWTWHYGDAEIPAGELGIVGTHEAYRRRGLVRAQVDTFKARLRQRGCLLSQIQGIPYFYRQFGYEYALPLEANLRLELRQVPSSPQSLFTFRRATSEDIPALQQLYDDAAQDLTIHAARSKRTWHYLQTHARGTATERERWLLETAEGRIAGYISVARYHFGEELTVDEASRLSFEGALATLKHLKTLAAGREKPGIRLNLPTNSSLARLVRSLDGHDSGAYAWQIHIPDVAALLRALRPVLEPRVASSPFAGLTRDLQLNLYQEQLTLHFEAGRLIQIGKSKPDAPQGEVILRCPPLQFTPLLLGYRSWRELHSSHPDVSVPPTWRLLVDTLFPKARSFLYSPY